MAFFETKFEIGQIVYVIKGGNIRNFPVQRLDIEHYNNGSYGIQTYLTYGIDGGRFKEDDIFATKEEAVIKWLESQNVDMLIIKGAIK